NRQLFGVVLDASELLGTEKRVAFAMENLRHEAVGAEIRLLASLSREAIEAAPDFASLADEMTLNDGQSLTTGQIDGAPVTVEPSSNWEACPHRERQRGERYGMVARQ